MLLKKQNFLFFIGANVVDISGPFVCPLSGIFLFLRLNKILVAACLGHCREPYAFKVTFYVLRFFGLFVADPWLGNATRGLERGISVISKVQRTRHIASTVAPAFHLVLRRTVSQFIWKSIS